MRNLQYIAITLLTFGVLTAYAAPAKKPAVPPTPVTVAAQTTSSAVEKTQNVDSTHSAATSAADAILPQDDIQRFIRALAGVKQFYVKDVSDEKLFDNAIRGMLSGLDPHSDFLDPDDLAALQTQTTGQFAGIGLELSTDKNYIVVVAPMDGTPAAKAGIVSGDYVVKVNGKPVMADGLREAVNGMRGPVDTQVKIMVYHKKDNKLQELTLTREIIKVQSVKSLLLAPGYGYIRIAAFDDPTAKDVERDLKKLVKDNQNQPLKGLILDLRNDPGGLLESAVDVADIFLDSTKMGKNHLIVYTVGRVPDAHFEARATPGDLLNGVPIVVLINEGSASAAEIVAGALQDQHRAILLGTNSFGKGSVQTVIPLDKNHAIKITTALYYTPDGRSIQASGIHPDVYVPMMEVKALPEAKMLDLAMVKESDLSNHLGAVPSMLAKANTKQAAALLNDYQLQEALHLLQGLVIAQKGHLQKVELQKVQPTPAP